MSSLLFVALLAYLPVHAVIAFRGRARRRFDRLTASDSPEARSPALSKRGVVRLSRRRVRESEIERFLPVVMERVVVAVQCGLDIGPAMREAAAGSEDPVSVLLRRAHASMEGGLSIEESLREASAGSPSFALRHAFLYLGLAHRLGGELGACLRELSDATQLFYQEKQEEAVAKLPVKATPWLLLSFCGLILFLLTAPLVQISEMASRRSIQRMAP